MRSLAKRLDMKILCIGRLILDIVVSPLETLPLRFQPAFSNEIRLEAGGGCFFASRVFQKREHEVTMVSAVGNDIEGQVLQNILTTHSLDTQEIKSRSHRPTSKSIVALDNDGNARYVLCRGADSTLTVDELSDSTSEDCDVVYIANVNQLIEEDGSPLLRYLEGLQRRKKIPKIVIDMDKDLNVGHRVWTLAPHIDVLLGNQKELQSATGAASAAEACQRALDQGIRQAVFVKQGSSGSYAADKASAAEACAYHLGRVVDENGAGDGFGAEVTHQFVAMQRDIKTTLDMANRIAGMHVAGQLDLSDASEFNDASIQTATAAASISTRTSDPASENHAEVSKTGVSRLSFKNLDWWIRQIEHWAKPAEGGNRIASLGCGTGRFVLELANRLQESAELFGVDRNPDVIQQLSQNCPMQEWLECDIADLDIKKECVSWFGTMQTCWMSSVLCYPNRNVEQIYRIAYELLQPGGRLLIRNPCLPTVQREPWAAVFEEASDYIQAHYPPLSQIVAHLEAVGFEIVYTEARRDDEIVTTAQELKQHFRNKAFVMQAYYQERGGIFEQRLQEAVDLYGAPPFKYQITTHFIVAERKTK